MGELLSTLTSKEPIAIGIFVAYFLLIIGFGFLVLRSVAHGVETDDLFSGRPFLFIRLAVGALGCTWYCEPPLEPDTSGGRSFPS